MTLKLAFPMPLTEKYCPREVDDFVGLVKPKKILNALIERPFESAWLFVGASGVGKTSIAFAVANAIQSQIHHIPSQSCDVDTVEREVRQCHNSAWNFFGPNAGKPCYWHSVIVDEAHLMTPLSRVLFLSLTDETNRPPRTAFFFTCNSLAPFDETFRSRCRVIEFERESLELELPPYLSRIYRKEGGKYPVDFAGIAKASNYNVREALSRLEIELLIGKDRKGLPVGELKIVEGHTHSCTKCEKPWKHQDMKCELPFRSNCEACGGAMSIGSARARKAIDTIRRKAAEQAMAGRNGKRKRAS